MRQMADQLGMVFSRLDRTPRWRERLPEIEVPTLVVHGRHDRFFPAGNGKAIAREIPGARLLLRLGQNRRVGVPGTLARCSTGCDREGGRHPGRPLFQPRPVAHDDATAKFRLTAPGTHKGTWCGP